MTVCTFSILKPIYQLCFSMLKTILINNFLYAWLLSNIMHYTSSLLYYFNSFTAGGVMSPLFYYGQQNF